VARRGRALSCSSPLLGSRLVLVAEKQPWPYLSAGRGTAADEIWAGFVAPCSLVMLVDEPREATIGSTVVPLENVMDLEQPRNWLIWMVWSVEG
jgi:hypothetical protein